MPRGRIRQTPAAAWRDSEYRILENLPVSGRWCRFNELLHRTDLSPTTLSTHLARLVAEDKAVRDFRTGRYGRTEAGQRWLDIRALMQEISNNANRIGIVGPARREGSASDALRWTGTRTGSEATLRHRPGQLEPMFADQTAVYAMPPPSPSGLMALANAIPATVAELVLLDRLRRDLPPGRGGPRLPAVPATRKAIRGLPRLLILKIDWDAAATQLDVESNRRLWRRILARLETAEGKKERVSTRPGIAGLRRQSLRRRETSVGRKPRGDP